MDVNIHFLLRWSKYFEKELPTKDLEDITSAYERILSCFTNIER